MEGDKVRPFVKLIKGHQFNAKLNGLVRSMNGSYAIAFIFKPLGPAYNNGADVSIADYAKGLVRYLLTHILVLFSHLAAFVEAVAWGMSLARRASLISHVQQWLLCSRKGCSLQ